LGGYLSSGQRCTATDRVLVQRTRKPALVEALRKLVGSLRVGDPESPTSFAGPLTTRAGLLRFEAVLERARAGGAEAVVAGGRQTGGFFARPSLHVLSDGAHDIPGYTDTELFGPDVHVETFDDDDEAIEVLRRSAYGLAQSIFTASDDRFERFFQRTHCGIVNRNRSTNQASPFLPFGGVGKSGNYRPGGAHVARSAVEAVAVQENVIGRITVHPALIDHLPPPGVDQLEEMHEREEAEEARRNLIDTPRPMGLKLPPGGVLPDSEYWLTRLYAGERVVREKKPAVFDHLRSAGPWYVSVDDAPLSVLDGMSQTATLCGGYAEPPVVQAFIEGRFGDHLVQATDTSATPCEAAQEFANVLRHLVPGVPHVTFTNSGAEAIEKALALCRLYADRRNATRVLAFEGGFHGRTLLALHATHSPSKRIPFEIKGYEGTFAAFPVWETRSSGVEEPAAPSGFYAAVGLGDLDTLLSRFGDCDEDPLLAAEVTSLVAVHRALDTGEYFACVVEPMQGEGGDRYGTARFFKALRLLTRYHSVSLIFDEVQTGFALSGSFAWHSRFQLVNFRGQPDYPDAVTFAKRAQVGVCMSRFEDPEPTSTHPAALIRGRLHAEMVSTSHSADRIQKLVEKRLAVVAQAFPHFVGNPRAEGCAFAFDLPTPEHLNAYLGQRFWRGAIVFGAGTRTVRYRLSEGFLAREIDLLFEAVRRSLAWLDAHPGAQPPEWEDRADAPRRAPTPAAPEIRIRSVSPAEAVMLLPPILDIEYRVYEPARRTPPPDIRDALEDPEGITTVAEIKQDGEWHFIGFAIGQPLEKVSDEEGPDRDVMLGMHNTLYSVSVTVAPEHQGLGIGRLLKLAQLREAASRKTADGLPRYRYVTSRNRIGHTARMRHLNDVYGAHAVCVLTGQYEDPEGQAIYYRIPLPPIAPDLAVRRHHPGAALDLAQGISRPLSQPPARLVDAEQRGLLYGPAVNKITLMNYATPATVRALEWVNALVPHLPHMYLTSSRDETVDKSLRLLRWCRKEGRVAIGFAGGYVGHTTAAARSISDPAVHRQGPTHFDWPRVPHPSDVGVPESLAALRRAIAHVGGPERVLGLYFELVQERTGRVFPAEFWPELERVRRELNLPLVAVETASACYRSGKGAFASSELVLRPDLMIWWGGAQTGYLHVNARFRVPDALMMVSTWDGDELSLVREHHQLRAARKLDLGAGIAALDAALERAERAGLKSGGLGLYRVLDAGERAGALADGLAACDLLTRRYPGGRLALAPGLDQAEEAGRRLARAFEEIL
jgi:4-aminobutyrate aminotransferase-like enzyme/GNAT superfamily N-acetyltransferase